ncbi:MAG: pilus assembly protein TadG, partial [Noviherbaspirillum sp.]
TEVGQPGSISSLADDWNSRFGIYSPSLQQGEAVPDFTGFAYTDAAGSWPSKFNAYPDFVNQRTANASYQGNASTGLNIKNNNTISTPAYLAANGADRRLAIVPVVDCSGFVSGSTAPVMSWGCVLMLHPLNQGGGSGTGSTRMYLEYRGSVSDPASPCATMGGPGGPDSAGPRVPVLVQ